MRSVAVTAQIAQPDPGLNPAFDFLAVGYGLAMAQAPASFGRSFERPEEPGGNRLGRMRLPASRSSPAASRAFLRSRLAGVMDTASLETATLLATELVTNAVVHAGTEAELSYSLEEDSVLIEVSDLSPTLPRLTHPGGSDTSGRGLLIISALSEAWGTANRPDGKAVWFRLRRG